MPRVEIKVRQDILDKWDGLARAMDITRTDLVKTAMGQYLRRNRMLLKIENEKNSASIKELEKQLKDLKEFDADKLQIVKIPK